jgi:hypothetical protein
LNNSSKSSRGRADDLHVRGAHEDPVLGLGEEVGHIFNGPVVLAGGRVCGKREREEEEEEDRRR